MGYRVDFLLKATKFNTIIHLAEGNVLWGQSFFNADGAVRLEPKTVAKGVYNITTSTAYSVSNWPNKITDRFRRPCIVTSHSSYLKHVHPIWRRATTFGRVIKWGEIFRGSLPRSPTASVGTAYLCHSYAVMLSSESPFWLMTQLARFVSHWYITTYCHHWK